MSRRAIFLFPSVIPGMPVPSCGRHEPPRDFFISKRHPGNAVFLEIGHPVFTIFFITLNKGIC
jgi:hypothetical protein